MSDSVSVVVPVYNGASTILRALDSALAQTHAVQEVIVVDDASTDVDLQCALSGIERTSVQRIPRRSGSPSAPRNLGVQHASGDWIAFLDSDDEWAPQKIERQLAELKASGAEMCATNAWRQEPNKDRSLFFARLPAQASLLDLLGGNIVITSSVVAHRSLFEHCGNFPPGATMIFEDWAMWLRIAARAPIVLVDEPLLTYTDDPVDSFRAGFTSQLDATRNTVQDFRQWAKGCGLKLGIRTHGAMLRLLYRTWRARSRQPQTF